MSAKFAQPVYCLICSQLAKQELDKKIQNFKDMMKEEPNQFQQNEMMSATTISLAFTWAPIAIGGYIIAVPMCFAHLEYRSGLTPGGLYTGQG